MIASCREHGIIPFVTLNHFTTPRWLAARGGWEAPDAPERFARYVERVRLEAARRRLEDTSEPIAAVAAVWA